MRVLNLFDPWKNKLCTCPQKYSFSPYVGCSHSCLYCYASSYVRDFTKTRIKKDLISNLVKDLENFNYSLYVSMSNSSDPYQPIEERAKLSRECLKIFKERKVRVLILTKSDLILRDIDILSKMNSVVSITITTLDEEIAKKLEPEAPSPQRRLEALRKLSEQNIPTVLRLDPIIIGINDSIEDLVVKAREVGVKHIVSSTYKAKIDSWKRLYEVFPEKMKRLKNLYFRLGERISGYYYLPKIIREKTMKRVKDIVERNGLTFACCREGFTHLNSAICDGSHLFQASS